MNKRLLEVLEIMPLEIVRYEDRIELTFDCENVYCDDCVVFDHDSNECADYNLTETVTEETLEKYKKEHPEVFF